jgi:hypothetical protein
MGSVWNIVGGEVAGCALNGPATQTIVISAGTSAFMGSSWFGSQNYGVGQPGRVIPDRAGDGRQSATAVPDRAVARELEVL